jgi:hypothetical protein
MSILIKDTTREEREKIVAESIGYIDGSCDGCMSGLVEMYQDYIDGKKEIRDINMEFKAHYESGDDGPSKSSCSRKE